MIVRILMHKEQWMGVSLYVGCIDLARNAKQFP